MSAALATSGSPPECFRDIFKNSDTPPGDPLFALLFKLVGASWDMSWHFRWLRDDFAPPHLINSVGTVMVCGLVIIHTYTGLGCTRRSLRLMQAGTVTFLIAAPLDVLNHNINGLDLTAWSPTHALLYLGTAVMILGAIDGWTSYTRPGRTRTLTLVALWGFLLETVYFANGQQEYGILALRAWERGEPGAEQSLLRFAADDLGRDIDREAVIHFALLIPDWVYPMWGIGMMTLLLIVARAMVRARWTATAIAGAYVGARRSCGHGCSATSTPSRHRRWSTGRCRLRWWELACCGWCWNRWPRGCATTRAPPRHRGKNQRRAENSAENSGVRIPLPRIQYGYIVHDTSVSFCGRDGCQASRAVIGTHPRRCA